MANVWTVGPKDAWAGGPLQSVRHWDGVAWNRVALPGLGGVSRMWGSATDDIWAVGAGPDGHGMVWHWDGRSWTESRAGCGNGLSAVWGSGPRDVWVAGTSGAVLRRRW